MADTQRGVALPQRADVNLTGGGMGAAPGVVAREVGITLPGTMTPDTSATQSLLRSLDLATNNTDAFGQRFLKEQREDQFKEGQQKMLESQEKFADAQAKGIIPQGANPWFIKGYQNQDGRVTGIEFYTQMRAAYDKSPAKGSDDPEVYKGFVKDFTKQYMGNIPTADRPSDWWTGFNTASDEALQRMGKEHAEIATQAAVAKQQTNTGAEINAILNASTDPKVAAAAINTLGDKMRLEGMPQRAFEDVVSQAVLAKAKLGNAGMLATLDYVKAGDKDSPATLASNPKVAMARVEVSQWLTDKARSAQEFAWARENHDYQINVVRPRATQAFEQQQAAWAHQSATWDKTLKTNSLLSQIQSATISDPASAYANTRGLLKQLSDINPEAVPGATNFVTSYLGNSAEVAAAVEAPIVADIRNRIIDAAGNPQKQIDVMRFTNDAFAKHNLNRRTVDDLFQFGQHMATFEPTAIRKLQSPELEGVRQAARGLLMSKESNPMGQLYGSANTTFLTLVDSINSAALDYLQKNPNASALDLRDAGEKALNAALPSLMPGYQGGELDKLGNAARSSVARGGAPAPQEKAGVTPDTEALGKLHPEDKQAVVKEAADAYAKGPLALQRFLQDMDQKLGLPGITRKIIEEANTPPPVKRK